MKEFTITKSEIGADKWPFTVDEVTITRVKNNPALYVKSGKKLYNLNGFVRKGEPLEDIWLDNSDIPGSRKSIGFIFKMCNERGLM